MRLSVKLKLLFILILIPIITLLAYRFMVGNLVTDDKVTQVFDNLATKNTEHFSYLKATFSELKTYDHILIDNINKNSDLGFLANSILSSNSKISEINVSRFSGKRIYPVSSTFSSAKKQISLQTLKRSLGDWKKGYIFKKFSDNSFLLINKYKKDNLDYLIAKIVILDDFKQRLYEDNIYTTYLINKDNNEVLFSRNELPGRSMEIKLFENFQGKKNILGGVKALDLDSSKYLIAYDEFEEGVIVLTLLEESTVMGVLKDLNNKSIIFLLIAVSFAGMLSLFASRNFTKTLGELHDVASKIIQGDYSVSVTNKTNDEIGDLATSFETMGQKVAELLSKLKKYNKKLESLVEKRTQELQKSLDLQSTMINSVNEAFMIVDKTGIISKTHSKASKEIFERNPSLCKFGDLLGLDDTEHNEIAGLFQAMISGQAPFDELKQFLPSEVCLHDNKIVFIDYSPMHNKDGECTNVVVTALDKTKEIASIQENEKQKLYVEMVLSILTNKEGYFEFINKLKSLPNLLKENIELKELYRQVHTLKGNAGYFKLAQIVGQLHDIESEIELKEESILEELPEKFDQLLQNLKFITVKQKQWLGVNPYYGNYEMSVSVSIDTLNKFALMLRTEDVSFDLYNVFINHLYSIPLENVFEKHKELLRHLAKVENIHLSDIQWCGLDQKILPNSYKEIFDNLAHVYRNIMSHAFIGREKDENKIETNAEMIDKKGVKFLRFSISDNGNGVNIKELITKLKENNLYKENMDKQEILNMILNDGISTSNLITELSGRGVGLSALNSEVVKAGGRVDIRTQDGKGTIFYITFPIKSKLIINGEKEWKKAA